MLKGGPGRVDSLCMGGWAGLFEGSGARDLASRSGALARRLHPHRTTLVTIGLAGFLLGASPLAAVVHGHAAHAPWHVAVFAASVPVALWALGLAIHATLFEPRHGVVAGFVGARVAPPRWATRALRAYATLTVAAFAVAPLVVLLAAAAGP